jgi:DNA-binding response OmpR family regulator
MDEGDDRPTVLVVEDESALVELYIRWLDDYEVRTAEGGEAALEELGDDVDVVLLDRLMPGMSGDEVLSELRERVPECKVAMVTAVEPDFDVITMGFDDYLTKPVDREELLETIERLLSRSAFAELEQELYALVAKQAAIRSSKPEEELRESEEFAELEARIDELRSEIDAALPGVQSDEFVAMVRDIEGEEGSGSASESAGSEGGADGR